MQIKVNLPTKEALLEAMSLAKNSKDAANYLATRFDEILVKAKVGPEADELRERVHVFAKHVAYQLEHNGSAWKGQESEESPFKNMHAHIADEATAFLGKMKQEGTQELEIRLDYAINAEGKFVRNVEPIIQQNVIETPQADEPTRSM